MGRKEAIEKEIYLSGLPKWGKGEKAKEGTINWNKSIGYEVEGIYDGIKFKVIIKNYNMPKITIVYNNKEKTMTSASFSKCQLGEILGVRTSEFRYDIGQTFKDKNRDIVIIDRKIEQKERIDKKGRQSISNIKWYKYKCNKCGFDCGIHYSSRYNQYKDEYFILENSIEKYGCACCKIGSQIAVEGINNIPTVEPWMIPYFQGGYDEAKLYTPQSNQKIYPVCPDCGRVKRQKIEIDNIYRSKSIACSCKDSIKYPNKFAHNLLEQLGLDFITEYTPKWCNFEFKNKLRQCSYDFYFILNGRKYILEMDGEFHDKDNFMCGQTVEESQYIDYEKDRLAEEYGIEVIRINCYYGSNDRFEFIKDNILNSRLNKLFDLNKIDWIKSDIFSCSNLIKTASGYKKNNPNMTCQEIGEIMGYNNYTIIKWLNKGNELGFCYYNGKEEQRKGNKKSNETNRKICSKPVEVFKNETSLGIFYSCHDLDDKSDKLFGTKLFQGHVSEVCRGEIETYKGFTFKYISKEEYEQRIQEVTNLNKAI